MLRLLTITFMALSGCRAGALHDVAVLSAVSPRNEHNTCSLLVTELEAACTIRGALAHTAIALTLAVDAEPGMRMEAKLVFPLPLECVVTGAALDIGPVMRPASFTFEQVASAAYESVVSRMLDPCLVKLLPDGRVSVQVFPIAADSPRRLRLEFAQVLSPVPKGLAWQFPLRLPAPVAEASLTVDAPHLSQHGKTTQEYFSDWDAWSLTAPMPAADAPWLAHPSPKGSYTFHGLVKAAPTRASWRHLLVLADTSRPQSQKDAPAERAFIEAQLQRMENGNRVTLAVFSTALHSTTGFTVEDGKCKALFQALDAMTFDGAPRSGAIDVSTIPADLTLVSSTLASPMGAACVPRLPATSTVLVMDSVSARPLPAARRLAAECGGIAVDPRTDGVPAFFHPRLNLPVRDEVSLTARLLPGSEWWLITGEFAAGATALPAGGDLPAISKGTDTTAGRLNAAHDGRERLLRAMDESSSFSRRALLSDSRFSPCLTDTTAFIVLENVHDYVRFDIALPPDLVDNDPNERRDDVGDFECLAAALARPSGETGDAVAWYCRLPGDKFQAVSGRRENLTAYRYHRTPASPLPEEFHEWIDKEEYNKWTLRAAQAARELPKLAEKFQDASPEAAVELIRQARELQRAKVGLLELLNPENWGDMLRSGDGPARTVDPFSGPSTPQEVMRARRGGGDASSDPFAGGWGQGAGSGFGAAPSEQAIAGDDRPAHSVKTPSGPTANSGARNISQILSAAKSLHDAGKKSEAIRVLSNLSVIPPTDHGLLRLLAWCLTEWGEPGLALEVMRHTERLFGANATTERDIGLAALEAGQPERATDHLLRVTGGIAHREAAALSGKGAADLRIVLECADAGSDSDLEIEGPDFALASWRDPLPSFGGALSFDGRGFAPEDFVLPAFPAAPLKVRVRLHSELPVPVRLTVYRNWARPDQNREIILLPRCQPGLTSVVEIPPVK